MAVHLLTLYGVLETRGGCGVRPVVAQRGLRSGRTPKHARFHWLEPPAMAALGAVTVADIVAAPSPRARGAAADRYVQAVWAAWRACHAQQRWYEQFHLPIVCNRPIAHDGTKTGGHPMDETPVSLQSILDGWAGYDKQT